jgi:hypothetical protein
LTLALFAKHLDVVTALSLVAQANVLLTEVRGLGK